MKLIPVLAWALESDTSEPLDPRLLPLLDAIAARASLAAAIGECGISYRAGWGLLRDYQRKLGGPLVRLERGRGAALTPAGMRLLDARTRAARRLARILPSLATNVDTEVRRGTSEKLRLRITASHDLVLAALMRAMPSEAALDLDVSFTGSLDALDAFAAGRADAVGFHMPLGGRRWDRSAFRRGLDARSDRLVRFVDREQGLMLPRGNPERVNGLSDIAARGLRFVNRQRGSGTRLLIDQIVADEGVDPAALNGFGTEEFTHLAVAATVASSGADAGFGLRAAASEYNLAFVPVVRERYFLAFRAKDLESQGVARLLTFLRGPKFARVSSRFPGYRSAGAGAVGTLRLLDATASPRGSD
ncbi:MAG TPA: substrate-binding domain-containing protein [Casimicrobiaceae bacterium]|nr:substrate-binding domain-containing protein [Casimicrobiaceae bacterium]